MNFFRKHKIPISISIFILLCLSLIIIIYSSNNTKEHLTIHNKPTNVPKIVNYFSSSCPHCHAFRPVWDKFKNEVSNKNIQVIDIQCDREENYEICRKNDIMGYPTVMLYIGNNNIEFEDSRSVSNLEKFCRKYIRNF